MHRDQVIAGIIFIQCFVCLFLGIIILKKNSQVLGDSSINKLQSEYYYTNSESSITSYYEPKPDIVYSEQNSGYTATYTINSDTLHERFNYDLNKKNETYRIITLGDSFTFGLLVNTKDNWTEKLEDILNKNVPCHDSKHFDVTNLGVPGYDIEYSLERYKMRGDKYKPDLVVWLIKGDDLWQVNKVIRPKAHRYTLENNQTNDVDEQEPWLQAMQEFKTDTELNELITMQKIHFDNFEKLYRGQIVYAFMENTSNNDDDRTINNMLQGRTNNRQSISFFSFPDLYQNKDVIIKGNGHPNKKGHQIMAESIFDYLTKQEFLCN